MKVTARVDYAIRAVFELALNAGASHLQAKEIADRQKIPLRFLEQILTQLKKSGLVHSIRGASGGYRLAKTAERISLRDVMETVEGEILFVDPRVNTDSIVVRVWREIESEFLETLAAISLQDLVRRKIRADQVIVYHI